MSDYENHLEYLESWSAELGARANRVRQLIGDRHWLTDGHHKEVIVREFLARYLPAQLEIGSGFIKPLSGDECSPEIDILISDNLKHPAYFNEGGIQILPPSSAVAYIEMKSTFTSTNLSKALNALSNTQSCLIGVNDYIWRCICFVTVEREIESFMQTVCAELQDFITELTFDDATKIIQRLPTCISSFDSYVVFLKENKTNNSIVLNVFEFEKLSASVAFSDLFEYIRNYFGNKGDGELADLVNNLPNKNYIQHEIKLNEQ